MGETMNRITNRPTCHQRSKNAFKTNSFLGMSVPTVHHEGKADRNLFTNYGSGVTCVSILGVNRFMMENERATPTNHSSAKAMVTIVRKWNHGRDRSPLNINAAYETILLMDRR